jgi:hypothetical protein
MTKTSSRIVGLSSRRPLGRPQKATASLQSAKRAKKTLRKERARLCKLRLRLDRLPAAKQTRSGAAALLLALQATVRGLEAESIARVHVVPGELMLEGGVEVRHGAGVCTLCEQCHTRPHHARRRRGEPGPVDPCEAAWLNLGAAHARNCSAEAAASAAAASAATASHCDGEGAGGEHVAADTSIVGGSPLVFEKGERVGWYSGKKCSADTTGSYVLFVPGSTEGAPDGEDFCIDASACGSIMRFLNGVREREHAHVAFSGPVRIDKNGLASVQVVAVRRLFAHGEILALYGNGFDFARDKKVVE